GQEAVRRSIAGLRGINQLRAGRSVEFKIVDLPAGRDPADVVQSDGRDAMLALLDRAVPVARWEVQRALDSGDTGTPEGRDRILQEVAPIVASLPVATASVLRDHLVKLVAGRLELNESLVAST